MARYIHNKSTYNVSLLDGRITIPVGAKHQINDKDADHDSIQHAEEKGWITIEGAKSSTAAPKAAKAPEISENPIIGSTTIPKKEKSKEPDVNSTALGTGTAEEIPAEAVETKTK